MWLTTDHHISPPLLVLLHIALLLKGATLCLATLATANHNALKSELASRTTDYGHAVPESTVDGEYDSGVDEDYSSPLGIYPSHYSTPIAVVSHEATDQLDMAPTDSGNRSNTSGDQDTFSPVVVGSRLGFNSHQAWSHTGHSPPSVPAPSIMPHRHQQHREYRKASKLEQSGTNLVQTVLSRIRLQCRSEWRLELPFDVYMLDTCARCYHYMSDTAFKPGARFSYVQFGLLTHKALNLTLASNETLKLSYTFSSMTLVFKWQQCCADAVLCCINYHKKHHLHSAPLVEQPPEQSKNSSTPDPGGKSGMCPPTWDGWLCWDDYAQPNQVLERSCPKHIYWHQILPPCRGYVTKQCNASGQWYVNEGNREWSNYTMCARDDIYARRIQYSLVTNIISICALIPALIIFRHYKQLSSMSRIRLHKHLFTSLLFHAIVSALLKWHLLHLLWESLSPSSSEESISQAQQSTSEESQFHLPSYCVVLSVAVRYFRSTNYLWMFNEALYLHQLIKHAFSQPSLRPLIILAYCLPAITTTSYILARSFSTNSNLAALDEFERSQVDVGAQLDSPGLEPLMTETSDSLKSAAENPFALYTHRQLNAEVGEAFTSLMHLPHFQRHLREAVQQEFPHLKQSSFPSWLHDLLVPDGVATVQRLVSTNGKEHESSNSNPLPGLTGGSVSGESDPLGSIEVLEDVGPLIKQDNCWLMPSYQVWHEWIIDVPNLAILIINCFFLVWLLRVLCIKAAATAGPGSPGRQCVPAERGGECSPGSSHPPMNGSVRHQRHHPSVFTRQSILVSLRAAVLLLPLYGLHYLFIVYRPKIENCFFSELYHYLSYSLDGLQGLAVSIIFCFANSEIRYLLSRTLQRVGTRQRSMTIYMTEVAHSINNTNNNNNNQVRE